MITEQRRRAYLTAMQVSSWLPRVELPFAAPSRAELLAPLVQPSEAEAVPATVEVVAAPAPAPMAEVANVGARPELPRPGVARTVAAVSAAPSAELEAAEAPVKPVRQAPPRFALQLLRAGQCLLLVELPTGEPLQSRDPAYLLLKDLLRAAGLPDSPQLLGEPVRWPLMTRGSLDQGPQAALEYVQSFVAAQLEQQEACACLWLVGLPAVRFAGEADAEAFNRELQVEGLGAAWALPGLELLMDEPARKAELWRAMRRVMGRWKSVND
ncbi:energy transducer TonB [Pseudomonas cavernae]|uniref:Energy transducer TonB n=1 Tax=Pseudomonas cavernae TaxID=2320867 RepID=A0A385YZG8_9PSED|nr:energy transducer TonB [Pseudomonas cavernae]AYC31710.1 energy transducer TonB [Pseudomonas cavernae]